MCDEVVINVGFDREDLTGDDGTHDYLRDHLTDSKFRFVKSYWDPKIQKDGLILSEQTNIALRLCQGKFCQYIQGDECVHEEDLPAIIEGIKAMEKDPRLEGLVFNYLHFYGNVDTYKYIRSMYRREIRLIKNGLGIQSWKDAQGFRHENLTKLTARLIPARIFHYGWARSEKVMDKKVKSFDKLYHGKSLETEEFKYRRDFGLRKFERSHPKIMKDWIEKNKNPVDLMSLPMSFDRKVPGLFFSEVIENLTGYRLFEYKNYKLL